MRFLTLFLFLVSPASPQNVDQLLRDLLTTVQSVDGNLNELTRRIARVENQQLTSDLILLNAVRAQQNTSAGAKELSSMSQAVTQLNTQLTSLSTTTSTMQVKISGMESSVQEILESQRSCTKPFRDCDEVVAGGGAASGVTRLQPAGMAYSVPARCEDGWTVLQSREAGLVKFNRTWKEYVRGFGDPATEYWLGLEAVHLLTKEANYSLRFELRPDSRYSDSANIYWYEKAYFHVADASKKYAITVANFSSNHMGKNIGSFVQDFFNVSLPFSTADNDNDGNAQLNCAKLHNGGFWLRRSCDKNGVFINPNAKTPPGTVCSSDNKICAEFYYAIAVTKILIRRV